MKNKKLLGVSLLVLLALPFSNQVKAEENKNIEWVKSGDDWFCYDNESIVKNQWISNYYLKSDGKMAKSEWIYDENNESYYYIRENGEYAKNMWIREYYLKSNGKMAKSEWIYDEKYDSKYYLRESGEYAKNMWIGDYYLGFDGKKVKNDWIYDENNQAYYYLKKNGKYAKSEYIYGFYLKENGKRAYNEWIIDNDNNKIFIGKDGKTIEVEVEEIKEETNNNKVTKLNKENNIIESIVYSKNIGYSIAQFAKTFEGKIDYVYGMADLEKGADCSGFTMAIFNKFGINIPRSSFDQGNSGIEVKREELLPGDIIFYTGIDGGHVALYLGNGKIIHQSVPGTKTELWNGIDIPTLKTISFRRYW